MEKKEFKGTQGDWECTGYHIRTKGRFPHAQAFTQYRCLKHDGTQEDDIEGLANALLMAAAPDLLKASIGSLSLIERLYKRSELDYDDYVIQKEGLEAAINKALKPTP